jgi:hypothetical protein
MDQSLKIYGFGGNAKISIHVSVPCVMSESELENAKEFALNFCSTEISKQIEQYKEWLDASEIDWKKIDNNIK